MLGGSHQHELTSTHVRIQPLLTSSAVFLLIHPPCILGERVGVNLPCVKVHLRVRGSRVDHHPILQGNAGALGQNGEKGHQPPSLTCSRYDSSSYKIGSRIIPKKNSTASEKTVTGTKLTVKHLQQARQSGMAGEKEQGDEISSSLLLARIYVTRPKWDELASSSTKP